MTNDVATEETYSGPEENEDNWESPALNMRLCSSKPYSMQYIQRWYKQQKLAAATAATAALLQQQQQATQQSLLLLQQQALQQQQQNEQKPGSAP